MSKEGDADQVMWEDECVCLCGVLPGGRRGVLPQSRCSDAGAREKHECDGEPRDDDEVYHAIHSTRPISQRSQMSCPADSVTRSPRSSAD